MTRFVPCSHCQRHVKSGESACPFCGVHLSESPATPLPALPSGLSRGGLVTAIQRSRALAGAALGTAFLAVGCGGDDSGISQPLYGAVCTDCEFVDTGADVVLADAQVGDTGASDGSSTAEAGDGGGTDGPLEGGSSKDGSGEAGSTDGASADGLATDGKID